MPQTDPAQLPAEGFGSLAWWRTQETAATEMIARYKDAWTKNVERQMGQVLTTIPTSDTVVVPMDHANVEQKKAALHFSTPSVQLTAAPGHQAAADAVQAFGVVLNEYLGPDGVDAESMADELLSDVLCPSGIGFSVIGFEPTFDGTEQVQVGEEPDPAAVPDPTGLTPPAMVPVYADVPRLIHQRYTWDRVSPLMGLLPPRFHGSNVDKAPWVGYRFEMDRTMAARRFGLTEEEAQASGGDPQRLNPTAQPAASRDSEVSYGTVISYYGSRYNPAVVHPEEVWRLILLDGVDRVLVHDRPYQQYAEDGKTLIGMRGHFVHVYTPRYISDGAIPPSDVSMSRNQVDELSRGRTQMIQQRNRSRPMRQIDINRVDPDQAAKIRNGEYQELVFASGSDPIAHEVTRATFPRENFEFNRIIKADVSTAWALGDSQRGLAEETRRTATELSLQDKNADSRLEKERRRFGKWLSRGAEKLAGLIQLFETDRTMVDILGTDGVARLQPWDLSALPLRFVCEAKPDTMVRQDSAAEFKRALDLYQMTANDPHANRVTLLEDLFRKANLDPSQLIKKDQPPPSPPLPSQSINIKGDDLNPTAPQFPIVQQILALAGITIAPETIALGVALAQKQLEGAALDTGRGPALTGPAPRTAHGGPTTPVSPLSKHLGERTGDLPGGGAEFAPAVS